MKSRILLLAGLVLASLAHTGSVIAQYEYESKFGSFGTAVRQFDDPAGIAVDSQDRIVVIDRFNDRVQHAR